MKPADIDPTPEPIWYFRSMELYNGKFPPFYDVSDMPVARLLQDNYEAIREEVLTYYRDHGSEIPSEDIGWDYEDPGWRTVGLYGFGYKDRKACAQLPVLTSVLEQVPNLTGATLSILLPGVKIHAHVGGTSAIIRTHLGISIPGEPPEVAIRVGGHTMGWTDGEVFGIETARRHTAWNRTDRPRIALTVDTIKDEFAHRRNEVNGRVLALMVMWRIAVKAPATKKLPRPVIGLVHVGLTVAAMGFLQARRLLRMQPPPIDD